MTSTHKLSVAVKIGFGSGDIFGGGAMTLIGVYYLFYLTDVVHLSPALAGAVIFVSKLWDAISDPLMGWITDRTRSRFGRRRPYFVIGAPLICLSMILIWSTPSGISMNSRFILSLSSYLFFSTVYTIVMIPYYAMSSELTPDYAERSSLMTVRMAFSAAAAILCGALPTLLTDATRSSVDGYRLVGLVFGVFFSMPFIAVFFASREHREFTLPATGFSFRSSLIEPLRNRSFRMLLAMYLLTFVALDVVLSVVIYFVSYYLQIADKLTLIVGAMLVVQVFAMPAYHAVAKRHGKKAAYTISAAIWLFTMLSSLLLKPSTSIVMILVFGAAVGAGTSGVIVMIWAMFADIPDVDELYSGLRREGVFSGIFTFSRKLSSAASLALVANVLHSAGYRAPSVAGVEAAHVVHTQPNTVLLVIRLLVALVPAVLLLFALVFASRFPLTMEKHAVLATVLARRKKADVGADWREQYADEHITTLKRTLIGNWTVSGQN